MSKQYDLRDWRAMRERNYAQEGIPVILAAETVGAVPPRAGEPQTAAAYRGLAESLADFNPAPADLIEVVAERELRRLGQGGMKAGLPDPAGQASQVERMLREVPLIRAVNFHDTPASRADELERQLAHLARHFDPVDPNRLNAFFETGAWSGRPGILLTFYNGYRSNFDVARPLLDRYGLVGWYFVVSGFVGAPAGEQRAFAARNGLSMPDGAEGIVSDPRIALSWDEVRQLGERHVVASHTRSHVDVGHGDAAVLRNEIVGAQDDFRAALGHRVQAFAANKGGAFGQNPLADRLIEEAGYRFLFSNLKIQRIRGER